MNGETSDECLFQTDHGPRAFAKGDRILFTRNDANLGVRNGMLGTVETVADKRLTVGIDVDETGKSRTLTFSPREFPAIDHGFAVSIHRSQGCTVDRSFVLASQTLDENLAYVALTRHREETRFYNGNGVSLPLDSHAPSLPLSRCQQKPAPTRGR